MAKHLGFLVIGVQKSATTSLDQYLRLHPDIDMPEGKKELHFFDKPDNYSLGKEFYNTYFKNSDNRKLWGECTPIYCYWSGVIKKIYNYNPHIKLILILRNPIQRAFSHWNMEFTHSREDLSFYDALINEKSRLALMPNMQHRVYSYLDRGKYTNQIRHIWSFFAKENILIIKADDLISSPNETMNSVYKFLGVDAYKVSKEICSYTGQYNRTMTDREKQFLMAFFKEEIISLEKMLNWDCTEWLENNN